MYFAFFSFLTSTMCGEIKFHTTCCTTNSQQIEMWRLVLSGVYTSGLCIRQSGCLRCEYGNCEYWKVKVLWWLSKT
jgi:hypothetical protein